jgi:phospholipid/cholesterol/gamma-HCH transport system substrate-binding protein
MFSWLKRPIEGYNKIWLGTISLALTALVVVALVVGVSHLAAGHSGYRGEFLQAAQIRPGDQVTVAGISVGAVSGVELAGDHVVVKFTARDDVHLGRDTRAAIKLTTLLGSRYLELSPAGAGELDHRTIALANTTVPYDLQTTLADATTTFEQVDADRVAESLGTLSHALDGVPEALPQALDNVGSLAAVISGRRDQIGSLLRSVDTVTAMMRDQQTNMGSLVVQGRDLLGEIVSRRAAVQRLFDSTTALVKTVKSILDNQPATNEMLANLREFSTMLAQKDALLRNLLQILPVPIRNVANATGNGTAIDVSVPAGGLVDSWMCAISSRADQFNLTPYFTNCKPAEDLWPGWPAPDPARLPR